MVRVKNRGNKDRIMKEEEIMYGYRKGNNGKNNR